MGADEYRGCFVAVRKSVKKEEPKLHVIDFSIGSLTYQIDTERQKVYRRFVEIETSRAATIYSTWRASTA